MLCIGGPLNGQDFTVKGSFRPAFFIREYTREGTRTHLYTVEKLYYGEPTPFDIAEPPYNFIGRHQSVTHQQAEEIIERDFKQKFVDTLIFPC